MSQDELTPPNRQVSHPSEYSTVKLLPGVVDDCTDMSPVGIVQLLVASLMRRLGLRQSKGRRTMTSSAAR